MAHYVDNKRLLAELIKRRAECAEAEAKGLPKPRVSEYIGECILKTSTRLFLKPNFIRLHLYKEAMILDGIETCLRRVDNFDPERSSNPFAYFTQIIYNAFLYRIRKEKRQWQIKQKLISEMPFDAYDIQSQDEDNEYTNNYVEWLRSIQDTNSNPVADVPDKPQKKAKATSNLSEFL